MRNGILTHFTFDAKQGKDAIEAEIREILSRRFLEPTYLQIHEPAQGKRVASVVCKSLTKGSWNFPRAGFKIITKQDAQEFLAKSIQPGTNIRILDVNNADKCWHIRRGEGWAAAEIAHLPVWEVPENWDKLTSALSNADMRDIAWAARKSINKSLLGRKVSLL